MDRPASLVAYVDGAGDAVVEGERLAGLAVDSHPFGTAVPAGGVDKPQRVWIVVRFLAISRAYPG